jgi:hypothetical protein
MRLLSNNGLLALHPTTHHVLQLFSLQVPDIAVLSPTSSRPVSYPHPYLRDLTGLPDFSLNRVEPMCYIADGFASDLDIPCRHICSSRGGAWAASAGFIAPGDSHDPRPPSCPQFWTPDDALSYLASLPPLPITGSRIAPRWVVPDSDMQDFHDPFLPLFMRHCMDSHGLPLPLEFPHVGPHEEVPSTTPVPPPSMGSSGSRIEPLSFGTDLSMAAVLQTMTQTSLDSHNRDLREATAKAIPVLVEEQSADTLYLWARSVRKQCNG